MIEALRTYIATCTYLDQYTAVNVEYLIDKVVAYSLNEGVGYNPIITTDILGNETKEFLFTFDSKFHWNEEIQNNIDNSKFYENFRKWLEVNSKQNVFPILDTGSTAIKIEALTNGYIFSTQTDEAIYRIQCRLEYSKEYEDE